ncbi:hypothetical protein AMAG_18510 [Allomyces macrogynus ATCC 38327]|uniref:Uncharacterized protein n=1 Tax=Allomyces macrogynus (strain ATCC 38327) TaxID=578462 RepID=A0A0L0SCU8_ALLM3|nr:hypothetical protein AMAG_18510 [Allomyces macrogynus ATCC 38327]|eukprot:KNE60306.1 hypothetical protein AMAG_18510 [Allomyces macrogynus ATCC 38327]
MAPLPNLHTLSLACMHDGTTLMALLPRLPETLHVLHVTHVDLSAGELVDGLELAHKRGMRWPNLAQVDLIHVHQTWGQFEPVMDALMRMNEDPDTDVVVVLSEKDVLAGRRADRTVAKKRWGQVSQQWAEKGWSCLIDPE